MRTTLTLEPDVAAALERLQRDAGLTLKGAVNQALRLGLRAMEAPVTSRAPYRTPSTSLGKCLIGSLDDVAEALAMGEGEDFR